MKTRSFLALLGLTLLSLPARATTIDFEIGAPTNFLPTTALTNEFAGDGVVFAGPGGNDGGAILNEGAGFGVLALSGTDFLAFNSAATLMDGGIPQGPEMIVFNSLVSSVSIWASSGGLFEGLFQLEAFDSSDVSLGSAQVATAFEQWSLLSFAGPDIKKVQLTELTGIQAFLFDDLTFEPVPATSVPEPGTFALLLGGLLGLAALRRAKARILGH